MKRLFLLVLPLLSCSLFGQKGERISPAGTSYFDPEINNIHGLMTYQKPNGEIWIAALDPVTGLFNNQYGNDEKVGDDAAPLSQTFNGPEFGYDENGWRIFYTKEVDNINQVWQIKKENGIYVSSQVAAGPEDRQSVLASKNTGANSVKIVYSIGGFDGVMAWKDLSDLQNEVIIDSVDRGIRWIDHSNSLAYIKQSGDHKGEIAVYDTDTGTEEIISNDGRPKSNCYGWFAPEYDHQLLVACLVDNDKKIAVYKKNDGVWEIFLEFQAPQASSYLHFGSPEAFVAAGKSYISCVVKEQENAYSNSEVWFFSLGVALGREAAVQLKMEDGQEEIIRTDPETYIGEDEVFIYYNVIAENNTFEAFRARTNLETLNSDNLSFHFIKPQETDSNITGNNEHHYALTDASRPKLNKLLVFFPGSRARPYDYLKFSKTAAELGYHAIVLSYDNLIDVNYTACGGTTDVTCHGRARNEIWTGEDTHQIIEVTPENSILNRLEKLLAYLSENHPEENWRQFLVDQKVAWENIVVAGHSQGGGHAGFASKRFEVDRCIMIAASDWVQMQTSQWIRTPGPTPEDRYYGFIHLEDTPAANIIIPTWEDYGILNYGAPVIIENSSPPYNEVHGLFSNTPMPNEHVRPHNFVIVDFFTPNAENYNGYYYSDVWEYLLNNESTTSLNRPERFKALTVFPNPAGEFLYVDCEEGYQIFDGAGKPVMASRVATNLISVGHLPSGMYILRTEAGIGRFVKK